VGNELSIFAMGEKKPLASFYREWGFNGPHTQVACMMFKKGEKLPVAWSSLGETSWEPALSRYSWDDNHFLIDAEREFWDLALRTFKAFLTSLRPFWEYVSA
jgi:hypothetical protein